MPNSPETFSEVDDTAERQGVVHGASRTICFLVASVLLALAAAQWTGSTVASLHPALPMIKLALSIFFCAASLVFMRLALPVPQMFTSQQNV